MSGCPNPVDMAVGQINFNTQEFRTALDWLKELAQNQGNSANLRPETIPSKATAEVGIFGGTQVFFHWQVPKDKEETATPVMALNGASSKGSLGLGASAIC